MRGRAGARSRLGGFALIPNLVAGTCQVRAWHHRLGTASSLAPEPRQPSTYLQVQTVSPECSSQLPSVLGFRQIPVNISLQSLSP